MSKYHYLTLTLACHTHNGFAVAGGAGFTLKKDRDNSFDSVKEEQGAEFTIDGCDYQFILDKKGSDGNDVIDSKPISKETAMELTGDSLQCLIEKALTKLKRVQPFSFSTSDPLDFTARQGAAA